MFLVITLWYKIVHLEAKRFDCLKYPTFWLKIKRCSLKSFSHRFVKSEKVNLYRKKCYCSAKIIFLQSKKWQFLHILKIAEIKIAQDGHSESRNRLLLERILQTFFCLLHKYFTNFFAHEQKNTWSFLMNTFWLNSYFLYHEFLTFKCNSGKELSRNQSCFQ